LERIKKQTKNQQSERSEWCGANIGKFIRTIFYTHTKYTLYITPPTFFDREFSLVSIDSSLDTDHRDSKMEIDTILLEI